MYGWWMRRAILKRKSRIKKSSMKFTKTHKIVFSFFYICCFVSFVDKAKRIFQQFAKFNLEM